jgi:hypothetical protein
MLQYYHQETKNMTATEFADKFTYEHDRDPKNTLIEAEPAMKAYEKNLLALTKLVDNTATVKWTVGYMSTLMAIMKGNHLNSQQKVLNGQHRIMIDYPRTSS